MTTQALIVDDSRTACRMLARHLAEYDIHALSVYSAEQALEHLRHSKPNVIFLDQSMPGMDGLETIKVIKNNPDTATIPVMMYTAQEGSVYLGQARALGAVDVLSKDEISDRMEESLVNLGLIDGRTIDAAQGSSSSSPAPTADPPKPPIRERRRHNRRVEDNEDWRAFVKRVQNELSQQMYLILTEQQIAQKDVGRRMIRSVNKTFETHTEELARRLEVAQDLRMAETRDQDRRRQRTLLSGMAGIALLVVLAFGWSFGRPLTVGPDGMNQHLGAVRADVAGIRQSLADLRNAMSASGARPVEQRELIAPGAILRRVEGSDGGSLGQVIGLSGGATRYQAVSNRGYVFDLDGSGHIGVELGTRYFAAPNCNGQPLAESQPGVVHRDPAGGLWFTALAGATTAVRPASALNPMGECRPLDSATLRLRLLLPNVADTTGVSVSQEPAKVVATGS